MKRLVFVATFASLFAVAIAGCSFHDSLDTPLPSEVVQRDVGVRPTPDSSGSAVPGFFFFYSLNSLRYVVEYSRSAAGKDAPLRQVAVNPRGTFFGADRKGLMYIYVVPGQLNNPCVPCKVVVQEPTGDEKYSVTLPQGPAGANDTPVAEFVDANGSIYYATYGCSLIVQLAPGAKGQNPKPVRTIVIPKTACKPTSNHSPGYRIFATPAGELYFRAPYGSSNGAWYVWPKSAQGNAPPSRTIIDNEISEGVDGVDTSGNAWTTGLYYTSVVAYYYGPTANGKAQATMVPLQGSVNIDALLVASNNQLVYEGHVGTDSGEPVLKIAPRGGGKPVRTLFLPANFTGAELTSVTF